jgi:hypothetical protein
VRALEAEATRSLLPPPSSSCSLCRPLLQQSKVMDGFFTDRQLLAHRSYPHERDTVTLHPTFQIICKISDAFNNCALSSGKSNALVCRGFDNFTRHSHRFLFSVGTVTSQRRTEILAHDWQGLNQCCGSVMTFDTDPNPRIRNSN